jgi:hypothetical protein
MLKTRIWLNGKRGPLMVVAVVVSLIGSYFGHTFHANGFFDG